MLSVPALWSDPLEPYRSRWIVAEPVREPWQQRAYFALRHAVFVREQGLFTMSDRDAHDDSAFHLVAMDTSFGMLDEVVGVVRIYGRPGELWYGGRLAVSPAYRRSREVGAALIRAAVGAARGFGASRFLATVQEENVAYFERHHFTSQQTLTVCDRPHRLMEAELAAFAVPAWARPRATRAA